MFCGRVLFSPVLIQPVAMPSVRLQWEGVHWIESEFAAVAF